ncbi:calcium-binding protein [Microvirga sp. P5_D2]
MSQPFLWGLQIAHPVGATDASVLALRNGTFLVIGKTQATTPDAKLRAWIYNADGSLKEEKIIGSLDYGGPFGDTPLTARSSNPSAVELPDGRIALTWSIASDAPGHRGAWLGIYGSDLTPVGKPIPVAGLESDPRSVDGQFKGDDAIGLADGSILTTYRSLGGEAFLRVLRPDGTLSSPLKLGPTFATDYDKGFGSVADLAALPGGKVVAAFRASGTENKVYVLDPTAAGGPSVIKEISIPIVSDPGMMPIEVTALEGGGFVVTWTETGRIDASGSEPVVTVRYQVYDAAGDEVTEPLAFYATIAEAAAVSTPGVVALPGGGFALAAQVVTNASSNTSEVRLSIFDAAGARLSEKLLVSKQAAGNVISLEGLSLLPDGRIAVLMSNGIQIVDPRDKAIVMKGTTGNDQYIGTAFDDMYEGSAGADVLNGGSGIDYVSFAHAKSGIVASLLGGRGGDAAGDIYVGIEGLIGSAFDDVFFGNGSAILKGGFGNDTYYVKAGDALEEAANGGWDTVIVGGSYALAADAHVEALKLADVSSKASANLMGSDSANEICGHAGSNILKGQGGDDKIFGGSGNDKLYGGGGKDIFVFDTKPNKKTNVDRIYDFNPSDDSFHLENKFFTKLGKGSAAGVKFKSDMFVKGPHARDREDRIIYDNKTGALYYDKDGIGPSAQIKIATLNKKLNLTYKDFFVI